VGASTFLPLPLFFNEEGVKSSNTGREVKPEVEEIEMS
jgi:hypothetical protein